MDPEGRTNQLLHPEDQEARWLRGGNTMDDLQTISIGRRRVRFEEVDDARRQHDDNNTPSERGKSHSSSLLVYQGIPLLSQQQTDIVKMEEKKKGNGAVVKVDEHHSRIIDICRQYSFCLGLLIGCFIQISFLGANFLFTTMIHQHRLDASNVYLFSVLWSLFTSALSVLIMMLLFSLFRRATKLSRRTSSSESAQLSPSSNNNSSAISEPAILLMECYFATGASVGVSISWLLMDCALGQISFLLLALSLATTAAAMLWCRLLTFLVPIQFNDDYYMSASTMDTSLEEEYADDVNEVEKVQDIVIVDEDQFAYVRVMDDIVDIADYSSVTSELTTTTAGQSEVILNHGHTMVRYFKMSSLVLGVLVGCFIEISSLGANYILNKLFNNTATSFGGGPLVLDNSTRQNVVVFSLMWSFFTCFLGVMALVLLRRLLLVAWTTTPTPSVAYLASQPWITHLLLHVELFFAVGALTGVNVAWLVTDLLLGLRAQLGHSILMLLGNLLWCKAAVFCFGYGQSAVAAATAMADTVVHKDDKPDAIVVIGSYIA